MQSKHATIFLHVPAVQCMKEHLQHHQEEGMTAMLLSTSANMCGVVHEVTLAPSLDKYATIQAYNWLQVVQLHWL